MKEKVINVMKSKLFIVISVSVVVLYAVLFPHTVKTKAISEIAGNYTISYEKYFLHQMVETKTENVCLPGETIRTRIVSYKFNGEISSIHIENCDSTSKTVKYGNDNLLKESKQVIFIGDAIRTTITEYNKYGQAELITSSISGTVSTTSMTYNDDHVLIEREFKTEFFESLQTKLVSEFDSFGTNTSIMYEDKLTDQNISLTCVSDLSCTLDSFTSSDYDIYFNDTTGFYEVSSNGKTSMLIHNQITTWNYSNVLSDADSAAETLKD